MTTVTFEEDIKIETKGKAISLDRFIDVLIDN
jgi:hypothetical protein